MIKDIHKAAEDAHTYIKRNREILGEMRMDDFRYTLKQLMEWSKRSGTGRTFFDQHKDHTADEKS